MIPLQFTKNHQQLVALIGLKSNAEGFVVFAFFGCFMMVIGGLFFDYHSDLPKLFQNLIEEPVSIFTFAVLYPIGLFLALLPTRFGSRDVELDPDPPMFLKCIGFPVARAGGSAGAVAAGMLVGVGLGLWTVGASSSDKQLIEYGHAFFSWGVMILGMLVPLTLFFFYVFSAGMKWVVWLDALAALYVAVVIYVIFNHNNEYELISVGSIMALLVTCPLLVRKL